MRTPLRSAVLAFGLLLPLPAMAVDPTVEMTIVRDSVENHVLPRIAALAEAGAALDAAAQESCLPGDAGLVSAYNAAFDAWITASHLDFGPADEGHRAAALSFWPDPRGFGQKALKAMVLGADPVIDDPAAFAEGSVAVRGFFALEYLLYDPAFADLGDADYRCRLIRAEAADIAGLTGAIQAGWTTGGYAALMESAGENETYRSPTEAVQELYKTLYLGLEFTANNRLGLPMGTFDKPNPKKAEAWRSGRSLRNVMLSLDSLRDLANRMGGPLAEHPDLATQIDYAFGRALEAVAEMDDPVLAGVADPIARFRVESLQTTLFAIRDAVRGELGPALGVSQGFSSNDGD